MKTIIKVLIILTLLTSTHLAIAQDVSEADSAYTNKTIETIEEIYKQNNQSKVFTSSSHPEFYSSRDKIKFLVQIAINLDEYERVNCFDIYDGMRKTNAWKQISSNQQTLSENIEYFRNLLTTNNGRPVPRTTTRRPTSSQSRTTTRRTNSSGQNQPSSKPTSDRVDMGSQVSFFAYSKEDAVYLSAALLEYLENYKEETILAYNKTIKEEQDIIVKKNKESEQLDIERQKYREKINKEYGFNYEEDRLEKEEALKKAKEWGTKITITEVELAEIRARLEETQKQKELTNIKAEESEAIANHIRNELKKGPENIDLLEQLNDYKNTKQKMNEIILSLSEKIIDLNIDQAGLMAKLEKMAIQKHELEYYPMIFKKWEKVGASISNLKKTISYYENSIKIAQYAIDSFKSIIADDIYVTKSQLNITITPIIWEEDN